MKATIATLTLLALTLSCAANAQVVPGTEARFEGLPNGGLEGALDEAGVGTYFGLNYDGAELSPDVSRSGDQAVNLAKGGATPTDWNALGQLVLRPYAGTPFSSLREFSFYVKVPAATVRPVQLQLYMGLDTTGDAKRDLCPMYNFPTALGVTDWQQLKIDGATPLGDGGPDCAGMGSLVPLSVLRASPAHAKAVVMGIHLQTTPQAASPPTAWPQGQPIYVDDASLKLASEPGLGPAGYHAQFTFTPPLVAAVNPASAETFDLSHGSVNVLVKLYDNFGRPKDFRNGVDTDGTSARARLVLNGNEDLEDAADRYQFKATGVINEARQSEATFVLPAAELLHLQQSTTQWEMHVESRYEPFAAGGDVFPYAFAFYNRQANNAFANDPSSADALDKLPSLVNAVLKPVKLALSGVLASIKSGEPFTPTASVLDEANRPIATRDYSVQLAKFSGPADGRLDASTSKMTIAGSARFTGSSFDRLGTYKIVASTDSPAFEARSENISVALGDFHAVRIVNAQDVEVGDLNIGSDDQPGFKAIGVDISGNKIGPVAAKWTLTSAGAPIGALDPADTPTTPLPSILFNPSSVGTGKINITHVNATGVQFKDETGTLRVQAGALHHLKIGGEEVRTVGANEQAPITFLVGGRDADENPVSIPSGHTITWTITDASSAAKNGGSFAQNVLTPSGVEGSYIIRASSSASGILADTVSLTITKGTIRSLVISTPVASRAAAVPPATPASITYAANALDAGGNTVSPFSSEDDVTWTISSQGGTFAKNVLSPSNRADSYAITVRLKSDPAIFATSTFSIRAGPWVSLEIAGGSRTVSAASGPMAFSANGRDAAGNLNVSINSADHLTWSVANSLGTFNKNVLTLSGTVGAGNVRAVLKSDSTKASEVVLTVKAQGLASIQIIEQDLTQKVGQLKPVDLSVSAKDSDGQPMSVDAANGVAWSISSGTGGAFTKNRLVPGEKAGAYTITASLINNPGVSDTATLTIQAGSVASLDILGGDIVQTIGATKPVPLAIQGLDSRGNVADNAPVVDWSISDPQGGSIANNVLSPGAKIGSYTLTAALRSTPTMKDSIKLTLVGPTPKPNDDPISTQTVLTPGQSHHIEYVLPADTVSAHVDFVDAKTGETIASVNLTKSTKDGYDVWTGTLVIEKEGVYERRLFYETSSGDQQSVAEAPLKVAKASEKKDTAGPGALLVLAGIVLGAVLLRPRRKA